MTRLKRKGSATVEKEKIIIISIKVGEILKKLLKFLSEFSETI